MQTEQLPVKVPELDVQYPKPRETPPYFPKTHFLGLFSGSRGSGKTTVLLKFVSEYEKTRTFDRIYVVSPSFSSDRKYDLFHKFNTELHVYESYSDSLMLEIINDIHAGIEAHKQYLKQKALYKKYIRDKHDLAEFSGKELRELEAMQHQTPKPPFKSGKSPVTLLIFDDCLGSSLYKPNATGPASTFFYRHRHAQTSVLFLTQSVKNGLPRQLRANISLLVLFRCKSKHMAEEIADEWSAYVSVDEFQWMWQYATEPEHGFLLVDFEDKKYPFRSGFDKAFILPKKGQVMKTPPETKELPGAAS